ncbi:MAG: glycosyltransferase [Pseudomonadota bacterium]|nr:glycosyltransferase [Pseudomonadota bacterium]
MVKRVLMIAFHYPPMRGSSGIQRTLKFSQYLPESGWEPVVLTAHPRAYPSTSKDQVGEIANQVTVHRAFALNTSRHLSVLGRYPSMLALPDRWGSWWFGAVPMGLYLIQKYRPDVIWSTYPIATAHLIGLSLRRLTGLPWVADFRDPMTDADYPPDPRTRRIYQWIEEKTVTHCSRAVLTTPGAIKAYEGKFPQIAASRFRLIENGYDEENFAAAEASLGGGRKTKQFVMIHSGIIYPSERDPAQFFEALSALSRQGAISHTNLHVILRATAHDEHLLPLIDQHDIGDIVSLAPPISYREALSEMLAADGLLILQASNCNNQIPAKLYEYLRARRPILALTDPAGNTAAALKKVGIDTIAPLDSKNDIMRELLRFLALAEANKARIVPMEKVLATSRRARTKELSNLLDDVAQPA